MSPPLFFLGIFSISTVWVISSLGLSSDLWTFGFIPVLSVYFLCNHRKLRAAAVQARGARVYILSAAIAVLLAPLCARFTWVRVIRWKVCVLLVWLICMVKAFDFEKQMYVTDKYGAMAKFLVWKAITKITGEAMWMSYKGEWAYCCPYSRKLVEQEIDHYYTLQIKPEEQDDVPPENYELSFAIGSCHLHCVFTAAAENQGGASGDYTPANDVISSPVENTPSPMPNAVLVEKTRDDPEPGSSTSSSPEGEGSSSKADRGLFVEDQYTLMPTQVNKVEVSLEYQNGTLESYTFYNSPPDCVAELRRVLKVLNDEGNLIFLALNKDVGSSRPRAHARCYEFGELLELILNQGFKLYAVDLGEKYQCIISGHWTFQLQQLLHLVVMVGINYYQLTGPANLSTALCLLSFYALVQLSSVLGNYIWQEEQKLRTCVHFIIKRIAPSKVDDWYKYFQVHVPGLTFGNESYCYPYTSSQRQICMLESKGAIGRLPVIGTKDTGHFLLSEDLRPGDRVFNLRNLQLELSVVFVGEKVQVDARMRRTYDDFTYFYRELFFTEKSRAADLIALMRWLETYSCVGVCKEWPKPGLMYAYRYEELFRKVLWDGSRPIITTFFSPIDIRVE